MAAPPDRLRLKALLGAAFAALAGWWLFPGTAPDRAAFLAVARGVANPPFFVSGFGSRETPWSLRTFSAATETDRSHAPLIVALGDDADGVFQGNPPSPVDMAVIFSNFHRLGAKKAASAAVLAWDAPDVIGLTALETTLGKFDSLVTAAPVSRGASPQPLPRQFRKTSVPVSAVIGDASMIPVVNRVPLPGVILGGENAKAGFQAIGSEPREGPPFLLARWDGRVVFAFPLVVVMQRLGVPVDAVEIRPGMHLKLGKHGPTVPIDRYGRMSIGVARTMPFARILAEDLIDGGDGLFPRQAPDPVILCDERGLSEPATRAFSAEMAGVVAAIASDSGMTAVAAYPRPGWFGEWLMLAVFATLAAAAAGLGRFAARICYGLLGCGVLVVQFIGFGMAEAWLPGLAALGSIGAAWLVPAWVTYRRQGKDLAIGEVGEEPEPEPVNPPDAGVEVMPSEPDEVEETASPVLSDHAGPPAPAPDAPPKKKARAPRRKAEPKPKPETAEEAPKPKRTRKPKEEVKAEVVTPKPARKRAARKSAKRGTAAEGDNPSVAD